MEQDRQHDPASHRVPGPDRGPVPPREPDRMRTIRGAEQHSTGKPTGIGATAGNHGSSHSAFSHRPVPARLPRHSALSHKRVSCMRDAIENE